MRMLWFQQLQQNDLAGMNWGSIKEYYVNNLWLTCQGRGELGPCPRLPTHPGLTLVSPPILTTTTAAKNHHGDCMRKLLGYWIFGNYEKMRLLTGKYGGIPPGMFEPPGGPSFIWGNPGDGTAPCWRLGMT